MNTIERQWQLAVAVINPPQQKTFRSTFEDSESHTTACIRDHQQFNLHRLANLSGYYTARGDAIIGMHQTVPLDIQGENRPDAYLGDGREAIARG